MTASTMTFAPKAPAAAEMLAFLGDAASYPHRPRSLRIIQTHTSYVALVPPYVYKVKKPVNFGFLDFSTLERRHYFCRRELELNRRLCPRIYLDVVPIYRAGAGLAFAPGAPDAPVVEYAVKMLAMDEAGFLKRRLAHGQVNSADLDRIAARLQAFYAGQPPTAAIAAWGEIARIRVNTDENFAQTRPFIGQTIAAPVFAAIQTYTERCFAEYADCFAERVRQGWIKDCHGDLHLEHIHLTPEAVCIYDCIEFNDRLRYMDVTCDIAFLAMDLDFSGRPDLARAFVARMAVALEDPGLLKLLDFYKCYRAYVRGKVESMRATAPEVPPAERQASRELAQRYFRLALHYAVIGSPPTAIVVMGGVGTGKSTLARNLGAALGWEVLASDRLRKEQAGLPLCERSAGAVHRRLYSAEAKQQVYAALIGQAAARLRAGQSVILDATFSRGAVREQLCAQVARAGARCVFVETRATAATVQRRLLERATRADEISDARSEDLETLNRAYEPPTELDPQRRLALDTEGLPAATLAAALDGLVDLHLRRAPE